MDIKLELTRLLSQINKQIREVEETATAMEIPIYKMRDSNGNFVLSPLLAAKAQTLNALVLVNQRGR